MRRRLVALLAVAALTCLSMNIAQAAALRLAPILLDLRAGTATSTLRVWNEDSKPVWVQVRVFRWTQVNGKDVLETTRDVVVSPPMSALAPGSENLIRVVRVTQRPLEIRESYRLIVDQLPDPGERRPGTVNVLVRHALPLHFSP